MLVWNALSAVTLLFSASIHEKVSYNDAVIIPVSFEKGEEAIEIFPVESSLGESSLKKFNGIFSSSPRGCINFSATNIISNDISSSGIELGKKYLVSGIYYEYEKFNSEAIMAGASHNVYNTCHNNGMIILYSAVGLE